MARENANPVSSTENVLTSESCDEAEVKDFVNKEAEVGAIYDLCVKEPVARGATANPVQNVLTSESSHDAEVKDSVNNAIARENEKHGNPAKAFELELKTHGNPAKTFE